MRLQLAAAANGSRNSSSVGKLEEHARALSQRLVGAVDVLCNNDIIGFGASKPVALPQDPSSVPTVVECIEEFSASNPEQLTVSVGDTIVVQQVDGAMLHAQVVVEGEQVGSLGWIPCRCVSLSEAQLARLECSLILGGHTAKNQEVVELRAQIAQLERTLRDLEGKHADELASVRKRGEKCAEERVDEERIQFAAVVEGYVQQLEEARSERGAIKEDLDDLQHNAKLDLEAEKAKWKEEEQALKDSFKTGADAMVAAKELALNQEWEGITIVL